jgi:hypothetical protein
LGIEQEGHSGFRNITGTLYVRADAGDAVLQDLWQHTLAVSPLIHTLTQQTDLDITMQHVP